MFYLEVKRTRTSNGYFPSQISNPYALQTENAAGEKPCQIDGQWCDDEEIKEEIFVILGERPTDDVLKIYKK